MSFRYVQTAALGLILALFAVGARGATPAAIAVSFNSTPINQGNYLWFNSVVSVHGQSGSASTLTFNSSTITFTSHGTPVTLTVPAAVITFSASVTTASSAFNSNTNTWLTSVPLSYTGNVFLSGLAYAVPANFPSGLSPVTWSGTFYGGSTGLSAQWQSSAAVYQWFNGNMNDLGVKPVDSSSLSSYPNSDHAGTPESYSSSVHAGACGNGGSNYTGTDSTAVSPTLNPGQAPVFTSSGAAQNLVVHQSVSFTVTATNATTYTASSLPAGISLSSSGVLSGAPIGTGTWSAVITATNGGSGASANQTLVFTVNAPPTFTSSNSAQTAVTGQTYSFTATATNSPSFSATSLPPGLAISSTGVISGTPTTTGTWTATLTATNALGSTTQSLPFTVYAPPTFTSVNSAQVLVVGQVYSFTAAATNSPSFSATSLPPGLTIGSTGVINGTPTTTGTWTATLTATNAWGSATQSLSFTVNAPPTFTSSGATQTLVQGQAYSFTATATNATSFSGSALPPGVTVGASGVISGTPTAVGTWATILTASNAWGSSTQTVSLTVVQNTSVSGNDTVLGQAVFTNAGGTASYTAPAGTDYVIVKAWGAGGGCGSNGTGGDGGYVQSCFNQSAGQQCTVQVGAGGSSSAAGGWPNGCSAGRGTCGGGGGSTQVTCPGGTASAAGGCGGDDQGRSGTAGGCGNQGSQGNPFQGQNNNCNGGCGGGWTAAQGSCFNASSQCGGNGHPANSGDPSYPGNNVSCGGSGSHSSGCGGGCVIIACHRGPMPPVFTSSNNPQTGLVGHSCTFTVTASGSPTFSATPLPPGVTISGSGIISGTPTTAGSFSPTITATNSGGSATQTLPITVYNTPVITSGSSTTGAVGQSFTYPISASGSPTSFGATGLPPGLSVSPPTGVISGTPTSPGHWSCSVSASNNAATGSQSLSITVYPQPTITSVLTESVPVEQPLSYTITAAGNPTSFNAAGLPPGVTVNPATGVISGTPTQAGNYPVTLSASNPGTTDSATLNLTVDPVFTGPQTATAKLHEPFNCTIAAIGANTFSATGLPTGISVNTITGVISGTPTVTGTFPVQIGCQGYGASGSGTLTLTVAPTYTLTITGSGAAGSFNGAGIYDPGTVVTVNENPNAGYRASGWGGPDGASTASPSSATTTIVMSADRTLVANFVQQAVLTVTAGTGGTATGGGTYDIGTAVPITATPAANSAFTSWSGTGLANAGAAATTVTLNGNETVNASFAQTYKLAITGSAGGTFTGAGTYPAGTVVTISETAGTSYRTNGWSGPDAASTASPSSASTTIVMSANRTLVANFVQQAVLTVTAGTGGTATGGGTYDVGTAVPITATPAGTHAFSGWSGAGVANATATATTVTLTGNETVNAAFAQTFTLAITGSSAAGSFSGAGTYNAGTVVTVTETPNVGYRTSAWTGPDAASTASPSSASTTIVMSANRTLVANFVQQAVLTVTAGTGGTGTGGGTYDVGTTVTVTEIPNAGYRTSAWTGPNAASLASPSSASTTITMSANRSVMANFVQQAVLTVIAGAGGTATGGGTYDVGSTVPITATPAANNAFTSWSGTGLGNAAAATTTVTLTGNETVNASFVQTYTLAITGSVGGTFTGAGTYNAGTVVTVTETPNASYRINGWGGPDGASTASPSSASTTIVMSANRSLVANFVQQAVLTVTAGTGGTATGSGTYDVGTAVPITATPTGTYAFTGWSGSSLGNAAAASTTVTLTGDETVNAGFVQTFTLAITASSANGTFSGEGTYNAGTVVTVAETANAGYRASGWGGPDGASTASSSSASTTIVMSANRTLVADFVQQGVLTVTAGTGGSATGGGTYDVGSTVTITATAATSYSFSDWTGASLPADPTATSTTLTITGDLTVTANFATLPPSATITAAPTAFSGSPFTVTSTASAPADNLTMHSVEWLSPSGAWTVSNATASGSSSNRTVPITFPTTGTWTLRAGASVDNGATWVYSAPTQVVVSSGLVTYAMQSMAIPSANMVNWYQPSPVAQKTYQVQHVNP